MLLASGAAYCMERPTKKAKTTQKTDYPAHKTEPFPAWKWEVDRAIQAGDTQKFAALVKKHNITDQTFISCLPGLALIALGPVRTRVAMATILLDNSAHVDQTSPEPIAGSTTALGWACVEGDDKFAKFLIARGAKIRQPDQVKRHPLTLALKYHPDNVALIKTVMQGAHPQNSLPTVIANTKEHFRNEPREAKNTESRKYSAILKQLRLLDTYQQEIENSRSTRDVQ